MKEVVILKTRNGEPTDEQPDFLSRRYARILGYCKRIEIDLKRGRGDADFLLDSLFELKNDLKCLKQALNGKHSIIVIVDLTVPRQLLVDIIARRCGE